MVEIIVSGEFEYRLYEDTKNETGNCIIYKAQDSTYNRDVCIKIMDAYENVEDEAKAMIAASKVTNHVPTVFHYFFNEDKTKFHIIMEWIDGQTLNHKYNVGKNIFLDYMERLCDILGRIQQVAISHKDIKPENIIVTPEDDVYIIDFGISMAAPNHIDGTHGYKAPEADAGSNDASREKADMFSIGVMMYEYFSKVFPKRGYEYSAGSLATNRDKSEWGKFSPPSEYVENLDEKIDTLIKTCMGRNPKKRFENFEKLKKEIRKAKKGNNNWKKK